MASGSGQRMDKEKSGGMRIDAHGTWMGPKGKTSVFPDGPHKEKVESSAEGAGSLMRYEDTTEAIKSAQVKGAAKIKAHPLKPEYRN